VQHKIEPIIYGGGQQNNLRLGTIPVPLCVGFAEACELLKLPQALAERKLLASRRDLFISKLTYERKNAVLNGPPSQKRHSGNANIRFEGCSAQDILLAIQQRVAASSGSACTSGIPEPSYVLRAIGLSEEEVSSSIRCDYPGQTIPRWKTLKS